jgi:hypothetical protein
LNIRGDIVFAHAHDRALAELFFDLGQGGLQRLGFFGAVFGVLFILHGGASFGRLGLEAGWAMGKYYCI